MWVSVFGHLNFLFFLAAFIMRDILWLRIFAILSSICAIIYFYFQYEALWVGIFWEVAIFVVNAVQIVILFYEQGQSFLNEEEKFVYSSIFVNLKPIQFKKLMKLASIVEVDPGKTLIEQGKQVEELFIITKGAVDVSIDHTSVAECKVGSFIGEMSLISGEPATATVTTTEPTRYISWLQTDLKNLFYKDFDIYLALQMTINKDLLKKLKSQAY
ncbi:MAG: popeye domain-containing protein [Parachlamydia sp.]|jgi:hypothetical protein|nr:popeye domain-containing protein [Parachlamydia sp.]